jgi:hypothetical protein
MENVRVDLHPLKNGESIIDLANYKLIMLDDDVIQALINRFSNVQNMLTMLNMKGTLITQSHDSWFNEPWKVGKGDLKHLVYVPLKRTTIGEDGNCEVFRNHFDEELELIPPPGVTHVEVNLIVDELGDVAIIELETQDAIVDMLNEIENGFLVDGGCIENAFYLIVEYERNKIFKSTLVSQFNANPFFSKDRFNMSEEIHVFQ